MVFLNYGSVSAGTGEAPKAFQIHRFVTSVLLHCFTCLGQFELMFKPDYLTVTCVVVQKNGAGVHTVILALFFCQQYS